MTQILVDKPRKRNSAQRNPQWIIRECRQCGGHPMAFGADGWSVVHAFVLEGWMAVRDGNVVRVWWADGQEGTA